MRRLASLVVRWPFAVIAFWIALAVALPLSLPNLNDMAQKHPLAMLPADAPSTVAAREMTKGFQETGTDDLLLVVLSDERGVGPDQEPVYRSLVDALRRDDDVVMLQDFIQTPSLRPFLTSKDGKAWVVWDYDGKPLPRQHGGPARLLGGTAAPPDDVVDEAVVPPQGWLVLRPEDR